MRVHQVKVFGGYTGRNSDRIIMATTSVTAFEKATGCRHGYCSESHNDAEIKAALAQPGVLLVNWNRADRNRSIEPATAEYIKQWCSRGLLSVSKLHIEIVHYKGKNGSFASHTVPLWLARIVGVNGKKRRCDTSYHGSIMQDAEWRIAQSWAELLGCAIVEIEGDEQVGGGPPP
jgi:hypothetical protein